METTTKMERIFVRANGAAAEEKDDRALWAVQAALRAAMAGDWRQAAKEAALAASFGPRWEWLVADLAAVSHISQTDPEE